MICASLALLQPLLSLTHWIFRLLMLPYKSSSHSAKCVRCASDRSGGRRLAVRTAMEHHIGVLPRTPFPASRDFPSRGNEKIGGTGYCVTYDTDSQSRNAGFMFIARKGDTTTLGLKGRCPLSGSEHNPSTQPAAEPRPFFKICGEAATTTLGLKGLQTYEP